MESPDADVKFDRRGFLKVPVAVVGLLSLGGGTAVAQQLTESEFDAAAMLIGPAANRPEPDGPFFANKTRYHYIYWVTDDSGRWEITENDSSWSLIPGSRTRVFDALTSDVTVSNTLTETTVFESTVAAEGFHVGDVYSLLSTGMYTTTNGSEQFTLRFYLGSTQLAAITSVAANVDQQPWSVELMLTVRAINGDGILKPHTRAVFDNIHDDQHHAEVVLDTTIAETFSVTIEWSETNANNEVVVGQAAFERMGTA